METFGIQAYLFEPEYTEEELNAIEQSDSGSENDAVDHNTRPIVRIGSAKTGNSTTASGTTGGSSTVFCSCGSCREMPTVRENICCRGQGQRSQQMTQNNCLSEMEEFTMVCLQEPVLKLCFGQFLQYKKKDPSGARNLSNRQERLMAYRQLALWLCIGHHTGKGNRMVLPSCCVLQIRQHFPDENYVGFHEVDEALHMD